VATLGRHDLEYELVWSGVAGGAAGGHRDDARRRGPGCRIPPGVRKVRADLRGRLCRRPGRPRTVHGGRCAWLRNASRKRARLLWFVVSTLPWIAGAFTHATARRAVDTRGRRRRRGTCAGLPQACRHRSRAWPPPSCCGRGGVTRSGCRPAVVHAADPPVPCGVRIGECPRPGSCRM